MKKFIKKVLKWWNGKKIGKRFNKWRKGERVGEEELGNVYYKGGKD